MRHTIFGSARSAAALTVVGQAVSFARFILRLGGALTAFGLFVNSPAFSSPQYRRHIPPPPIKLVPLSKLEPARDVPAERWRAPYCLVWSDGCTRCERNDLKPSSEVSCTSIAAAKECTPTFSICSKPEARFFDERCRVPVKVHFRRALFDARCETPDSFFRRNDDVAVGETEASRQWIFEWEYRNKWSMGIEDNLKTYSAQTRLLLREGELGFYCHEAFSKKDIDDAIRAAREQIGANGHGFLWAERLSKK